MPLTPRTTPLTDPLSRLLLLALIVVRFAMVAAYPVLSRAMPEWQWSNSDGYDLLAINWVSTGTFGFTADTPTALRLPLYPALIAACYWLFGAHYLYAVITLQAILSILTGHLLYRMTVDLLGRTPALVSLSLFIVNPQANNFVFRCATETLFTFLCIAGLRYLIAYFDSRNETTLLIAAACAGLSLLVRQTLAPLIAVALCVSLFSAATTRRRFRPIALPLLIIGTVVSPWVIRNYALSGDFPVLQTWVGAPMFQGITVSERLIDKFFRGDQTVSELDAQALEEFDALAAPALAAPPNSPPIAREAIADKYARRLALSRLLHDPMASALRILRNLVITPVLQMTWRSTTILMLWNWPLLALSMTGALYCFRWRPDTFRKALPASFLFGYLLLAHALVWPQARYVMPGLLSFSLFAGAWLAQPQPDRRPPKAAEEST